MPHSENPFQQQAPPVLGTSSRRGFPLSLLFLLMALFAIPLAMLGALAGEEGYYEDNGRAGATVFLMLITGVVIGAHQYRRLSGMLMGFAMGAVFGALGAPLVNAQAETTPRLLAMASAGAVVLVVFSYTLRALSKKTPQPGVSAEAHPLDAVPDKKDVV